MTKILLIMQFILAIIITISVLLQKSSSIGLGAYSGSNETLFGAKGPGNFLAKITFITGFIFVLNTITLGYFYNQDRVSSVIDDIETIVPNIEETSNSNIVPTAPESPSTTENIVETLDNEVKASAEVQEETIKTVPIIDNTNKSIDLYETMEKNITTN